MYYSDQDPACASQPHFQKRTQSTHNVTHNYDSFCYDCWSVEVLYPWKSSSSWENSFQFLWFHHGVKSIGQSWSLRAGPGGEKHCCRYKVGCKNQEVNPEVGKEHLLTTPPRQWTVVLVHCWVTQTCLRLFLFCLVKWITIETIPNLLSASGSSNLPPHIVTVDHLTAVDMILKESPGSAVCDCGVYEYPALSSPSVSLVLFSF